MKNKITIKDLCYMSIALSLLIVGSKISFNIGPIPLTLQTIMIAFICLLFKSKSIIIILVYILMGLIGIPVFASGGGYVYLFKPSFGFIIGFLVQAICEAFINTDKIKTKPLFFIGTILKAWFGHIISVIVGVIYMWLIYKFYNGETKSILSLIEVGVLPFILKDTICVVISSLIYIRLKDTILINYKPEIILNNQE